MITKVTHLTVFVKNQDEALTFYTNNLGFKVHTDAQFEDMRWLTIHPADQSDFEIVLMPANSPEEKALVGKQAGSGVFFCLESTNIEEDYKALKSKGVELLGEPTTEPWGKAVTFKDLYGNTLYLVERV